MKIEHKDYLSFEIPDNWDIEENEDSTTICNNDGKGALVLSFYTVMKDKDAFEDYITNMAVEYARQNKVALKHSLILDTTKKNKLVANGIGKTADGWFEKFWFVGKFPKVVMATYFSEKKTSEINQIDIIIDSFQFTL